jgi:outer membrane lipoprotein-sorting protein
MLQIWRIVALSALLAANAASLADESRRDAAQIVRDAINHWRGVSSHSEMTMVIHRPDWERRMSMESWTQGEKRSLVRVTEPRKDRGNGTLLQGRQMWSYSPKVNRVIKIPSSMMNQGWMGSDFSNKDVSRSNEIVDEYTHTLAGEKELGGHAVYEIESVPHEDAAVVWGREVLTIREDNVLLEQRYYDQGGALVKSLRTLEIAEMGGRTIAAVQRMEKVDKSDEWTEVRVDSVQFDIELSDNVFTLSNLRNPRN